MTLKKSSRLALVVLLVAVLALGAVSAPWNAVAGYPPAEQSAGVPQDNLSTPLQLACSGDSGNNCGGGPG